MSDKILTFIGSHKYCVISTVDPDSKPESAFVAFSNKDLELFLGTSSMSRKFKNLQANPSVAVVIADENGEVQYEGQASVVGSRNSSEVQERHIAKISGSAKYRDDPTQQYVKITPTWIRFIEHGDVDKIEEFTEFS